MAGVKGKSGGARPGAGRKPEAARLALTQLLDESVSTDERKAIFVILAQRARAGDVKAAALLLGYIYGKPVERQEHTGMDGAPIAHQVQVVDFGDCDDSELRERLAAASGIAAAGGIPPKP